MSKNAKILTIIIVVVVVSLIIFKCCYPCTELIKILIKTPEMCDLLLGAILCFIFGWFNAGWLEVFVDRDKERKKIRNEWKDIISYKYVKHTSPGAWLGLFERILFFGSAYGGKYEIIGFWLVFKVASKWESWKNVVQVPEKLPKQETNEDTVDWFKAKMALGGWNMMRFQIGVILNILIGVGAAIIIKKLKAGEEISKFLLNLMSGIA